MEPATGKEMEKQLGVELDMYEPTDAINAETFLKHHIHNPFFFSSSIAAISSRVIILAPCILRIK
jgi:hypothetical protein